MTQPQYATTAQLQTFAITQAAAQRFGEPAMTAALQAASSFCDGYLASQFTLPLKTSPIGWDAQLVDAACALAAWRLYNSFGYPPQAQADELIIKRRDDAIKWLELVRDEEIFPQYADSATDTTDPTEAGPYVASDLPVGFTTRGLSRLQNFNPGDGSDFWIP